MNLREFREMMDITLEEMADLLSSDEHYVSMGEYVGVEYNECVPDYHMMAAFKEAFPFVSIDNVFFSGRGERVASSITNLSPELG